MYEGEYVWVRVRFLDNSPPRGSVRVMVRVIVRTPGRGSVRVRRGLSPGVFSVGELLRGGVVSRGRYLIES